ncbi:MAG: hypothetical protein KJS91_02530 [Planctomycetes bacterium]|nr:hypothetical protein [Planctomycetota bacterium]
MSRNQQRMKAAQKVAIEYRAAKMAGEPHEELADQLALMIAADGMDSFSPITSMCMALVMNENKQSQWGDSWNLASELSCRLMDKFLRRPESWDPEKATLHTWFRRHMNWGWRSIKRREYKTLSKKVHGKMDEESGEWTNPVELAAGKSDKGEAWESQKKATVKEFVETQLPDNLRIVALNCWFNTEDPKQQKEIAHEHGVAEGTVALWKKKAGEAITEFVLEMGW